MRGRRILAFALLAALLSGYQRARAADLPASWWANAGGISHHAEAVANSHNAGAGLTARWSDTWAATGGALRNSQGRHSRYLVAEYTPWSAPSPVGGRAFAGLIAGLIDGYAINNGHPVPLLAGAIEQRWQHLAVGVMISPRIPEVSKGAIMLMLKVRVPV